jgi:hypothetical protein
MYNEDNERFVFAIVDRLFRTFTPQYYRKKKRLEHPRNAEENAKRHGAGIGKVKNTLSLLHAF